MTQLPATSEKGTTHIRERKEVADARSWGEEEVDHGKTNGPKVLQERDVHVRGKGAPL